MVGDGKQDGAGGGSSPRQPAAASRNPISAVATGLSLGGGTFSIIQSVADPPQTRKKGAYGSFEKNQDLLQELRGAQRERNCPQKVGGVAELEAVPAEAYGGAACPLEPFCGLSAGQMPCAESRHFQVAFGNVTDLATTQSRQKDDSGLVTIKSGVMLGLPSFADQSWEHVREPRSIRSLHDEDERLHFQMALDCCGIDFIHKPGEDADKMMMTFDKDTVPGNLKEVLDRLKKLQQLDHINVARVLQACEDETHIFLIYEAQNGMGLLPLLLNARRKLLSVPQLAKLCQQLSAALAQCHKQQVFHLDWSLFNVMSLSYESLFPVRLFGVGLAGVLCAGSKASNTETSWGVRAPFCFFSPEVCRVMMDKDVSQPYRKLDLSLRGPADLWGLGVVVYMCTTGHPPFGGATETACLRNVLSAKASFAEGYNHIDRLGRDFMESLLQNEPRSRPKADSALCDSWVVQFARSGEEIADVHKVVDRMFEFSKTKPCMRTIGKVLKQSLSIDKLRALEGIFHALDIRGDGEIEPGELGSYFVNRNHELRHLFMVMDLNASAGISLEEFVLANIFGIEVLTERMLLRTFEYLDLDGTGEITAMELYSALKKYEPSLAPAHIGEFMGNADRDWDADIDFDEFRSFFPNVKSNAHLMQERVDKDKIVQAVGDEIFKAILESTERWKGDIAEELRRATKIRQEIERDDKVEKAEHWVKEMLTVVRRTMFWVRNSPSVQPPATQEAQVLVQENAEKKKELASNKKNKRALAWAEAEENKKQARADEEKRGTGLVLDQENKKDEFEENVGGPLHMNSFFVVNREKWVTQIAKLAEAAKYASATHSKNRKRQDSITTLEELEDFLIKILDDCKVYMVEQECLWEISRSEQSLPKLPFSRRGVDATEEHQDDAIFDVQRYREERQATLEEERLQEEARARLKSQVVLKDIRAAHKGFEWLQKQAAKAQETGRKAPEITNVLREVQAPSIVSQVRQAANTMVLKYAGDTLFGAMLINGKEGEGDAKGSPHGSSPADSAKGKRRARSHDGGSPGSGSDTGSPRPVSTAADDVSSPAKEGSGTKEKGRRANGDAHAEGSPAASKDPRRGREVSVGSSGAKGGRSPKGGRNVSGGPSGIDVGSKDRI